MPARRPMPYLAIRDQLLAQIRAGLLAPGDRLPSERELAERFAVSRMTVRHALDALVWSGALERRRGSGTYVAQPRIALGLARLYGFSEDLQRRGLRPGSRVLEVRVLRAGAELAAALGLPPRARVTSLRRLRLADGRALSLEHAHVPLAVLPDLAHRVQAAVRAGEEERISLYAWLDEAGLAPVRAEQSLQATAAGRAEARWLGVPPGAPLLRLVRVSRAADGRCVEYTRALYRGDAYRYEVTLARAGWDAPADAVYGSGAEDGAAGREGAP